MTKNIYQKQYSIIKILSESWKKFTENLQLILIITLIAYILTDLILLFVPIGILIFYYWPIEILIGLINIITIMAIAYAIKQKVDGKSITTDEVLKKSLSRSGVAIGTTIILGIFLLGLTLLLIVPGIIYSVYWFFALYAVILSDKSWLEALDYSKEIVMGRWWTVAGYLIGFAIFGTIISVIFEAIGTLSLHILSSSLLATISTGFLTKIFTSFTIVVFTILFINFDATKKSDVAKGQSSMNS